jgi:hypothetical protein
MSLYHVHLKDKFKNTKSVSLEEFLKYVNKWLYSKFTGDSLVFDVFMTALNMDQNYMQEYYLQTLEDLVDLVIHIL